MAEIQLQSGLPSEQKKYLPGNWFVAFQVSSGDWFKPLVQKLPTGLNSFHPDDLHMTVSFLGRLSEPVVQKLAEQIEKTAPLSFRIRFNTFLALPSKRKFSAICLGANEGQKDLIRWMKENSLLYYQTADLEPDPRKPLPHITLARPNRRCSNETRRAIYRALFEITAPKINVELRGPNLYTWSENRLERQFRIYCSAGT